MDKRYYDIRDDLKDYPNAWCYLVWSKRGPGKTYSTLRYMIEDGKKFIFMKRTIEDVNLLCARLDEKIELMDDEDDVSPFAPLNRDFGWDIYPFVISAKGLAGFWHGRVGEDGKLHPYGKCLGWILACSAVSKFKGFSMDADYMIFDEFIPKPWDRVKRTEGDSVLDMYETVSRDRLKRGRGELKLLCLANATSLNNPMFNTLNVVDIAANMDIHSIEYDYNEYRGILMHQINYAFDIDDEEDNRPGIQRAMEGTPWASMAYGGHFGYNDFTCIGRVSLKGYKPVCCLSYKKDNFYIYMKDGCYYMTYSRHDKDIIYNLNREIDQKRFYREKGMDIRQACIDDKCIFESFTMYDIIINYKDYFKM